MKTIINLSTIFYNIRRSLYAMMVIILAVSIPVLSYIELAHTEEEPAKTEVSKPNTVAKATTGLYQKQS
jgi:hypothetical protein